MTSPSPEVAKAPELTIAPANTSVSLTGNYTLVMADAGPVGTNESEGQTRHWLVNSVTLNSASLPSHICEAYSFFSSLF